MIIYVIRNLKVLTTFFLILIFNELFKFKTLDEWQHWKMGPSALPVRTTFTLRSHKDPFSFFTTLPGRSDQKIRLKCYLILRKLHRTRKIFLKIILRPNKIMSRYKQYDVNKTKQKTPFSEKTIKFRPHIVCMYVYIYIYIYIYFRGATAPKSQSRLKRLWPDGSTWGLVVSKALIPQP